MCYEPDIIVTPLVDTIHVMKEVKETGVLEHPVLTHLLSVIIPLLMYFLGTKKEKKNKLTDLKLQSYKEIRILFIKYFDLMASFKFKFLHLENISNFSLEHIEDEESDFEQECRKLSDFDYKSYQAITYSWLDSKEIKQLLSLLQKVSQAQTDLESWHIEYLKIQKDDISKNKMCEAFNNYCIKSYESEQELLNFIDNAIKK